MKKKVVILGSTGSIGKNALNIIRGMGDRFEVAGLTANQNLSLFRNQLEYWKPGMAAVQDESTYKRLKSSMNLPGTKLLAGTEGLARVASSRNADIVICAIAGSPALIPLYEAIKSGKLVGLASKEPIVMTGRLLLEEAGMRGSKIIPVDSEPNAIFQCMKSNRLKQVKNLLITASGGPFRKKAASAIEKVTSKDALAHPAWNMGRKISIDSATMINKGLEVIEAHNFFGVPLENIRVLIHPEAKIHSMVEFVDGNIMAVISETDMRIPIQYALTYPERAPTRLKTLDLLKTGKLTFESPDPVKFPGLGYCYEAGMTGGTMPAVLSGANETAVEAFLKGRIGFTDIAAICREVMKCHRAEPVKSIIHALETDEWAKHQAGSLIQKWN